MIQRTKYVEIADIVRQRIVEGDYDMVDLPGAPKLATEMGVSYLTARQAMQQLMDDEIVYRAANGRLVVCEEHKSGKKAKLKVAYIYLAGTPVYNVWRSDIAKAVDKYGCQWREVSCGHVADPLLYEALDGDYDLIFLQVNRLNPLLIDKLKKIKDRLITLFYDLTEYGIRCFDGPKEESIESLIKHLYDLGHRKIDCFFETERINSQRRQEVWRESIKKFGCSGVLQKLLDEKIYPIDTERAYYTTLDLIDSGKFDATAIFCLTTGQAIGVLRALHERNLRVPEDISMVAFGERILAKMTIPSITVICPQSPEETAGEILEHFLGIKKQPNKMMFRTKGAETIRGESTAQVAPK